MKIYGATDKYAGIMTSADKKKLDAVPESFPRIVTMKFTSSVIEESGAFSAITNFENCGLHPGTYDKFENIYIVPLYSYSGEGENFDILPVQLIPLKELLLMGEFVNYKQQHMNFHLRTATSGSPRPQSGSDIYEYDDDDDEYVYEDEDDDYEDDQDSYTAPATSGNTSAKGRQALADTEAFVKKLERLSKLTESDANRLDAEFNSLSSKYDDLKESDFSASDYKKLVELRNRIERAKNRLVYGQ